MAKDATNETKGINLEDNRIRVLTVKLIGKTDLLLHKNPRSFELPEIWKQQHPKGSKMPSVYSQDYNFWEKAITTIHWLDPIPYHDEDWSLYTEDEWRSYMKNNKPCILGHAFRKSFYETFVRCGVKDSTGLPGTVFNDNISVVSIKNPIDFESVVPLDNLAKTPGMNAKWVVTEENVFQNWSTTIQLTYNPLMIPLETLLYTIKTAGKMKGIGSRREDGYGRYELASNIVDEEEES